MPQTITPITKEENSAANSPALVPSISLPKGGGAIRSVGEKFGANPVVGTGSMSVPIATSPGRSGFGPQLSIAYDSGSGNGPFGVGWSLSIPSITRKTDKGLPQYIDEAESDVFILSGSEDLVPILQSTGDREEDSTTAPGYTIHRYRPRIEGLFSRIERWTSTNGDVHWRSISKENLLSIYGKDGTSRIADSKNPTHIFSWLISETRDDKGNVILYEYKSENGQGVDLSQANEHNRGDRDNICRTANRYLKRVRYGNQVPLLETNGKRPRWLNTAQIQKSQWLFEVVLDFGEHDLQTPKPQDGGSWTFQDDSQGKAIGSLDVSTNLNPWGYRSDPHSVYRSGFEVRMTRLCRRVLMFHHFPQEDGVGQDCLVRSTDFTYTDPSDPTGTDRPVYSFLKSVSQSSYRRKDAGYLSRSLPPVEFTYSEPTVQSVVEEVDSSSLENLPAGLDNRTYQWIDLHGEGLPGFLTEQADGWFYKRNLSPVSDPTVSFTPLERVVLRPNQFLAGGAQFMDLAGDGQPDYVTLDGSNPGLYEHDDLEGWQPFRPFTSRANLSSRDPNLKFIDLDGDGRADLLITQDDALLWRPSQGEAGFGPERRVANLIDEERGPRLIFADAEQCFYLADLSGDGLQDLARIRNGDVCYWPNLGYGHFGAKVTMDNSPQFDLPDQFEQKRLRLADIDGSGTTDLIYLHREGVRLYFNQSGNQWSRPQPLAVFPQVDDLASIVPLDLLGNGTSCLVWSSPLPDDSRRPMRYVNLMGSQKPHLLTHTINNLGAETKVTYAASTKFYLQDKLSGHPWLTRLPFPVHVVERVETYDYISRNRFVTRYAYHHGYFDGVEREFRGFGMVEQWDTEEWAALIDADVLPAESISGPTNQDPTSYVPPVHTKSWFHTGLFLPSEKVSRHFEEEYFREPSLSDPDFYAQLLPDTSLPPGLTLDEKREACRALKGLLLRQEIFAQDAPPGAPASVQDRADTPYAVTEANYTLVTIQNQGGNRHGIFLAHPRESLTHHYERHADDPRIQHSLTLEVDAYGNVLKDLAIGYGRRKPDNLLPTQADQDQQTRIFLTVNLNGLTNPIDDVATYPNDYHIPLLYETRTFELTGFTPANAATRFRFEEWTQNNFQLLNSASEITYETSADPKQAQKRLIEHIRTLFRPDDLGVSANTPQALLPLGQLQPRAQAGASYKLAFTPGLFSQVYQRNGSALLSNPASVLGGTGPDGGGYVSSQSLRTAGLFPANNSDAHWTLSDGDGHWWIPSGRIYFSPDEHDTAASELSYAEKHFFSGSRYCDTFGQTTFVSYDQYDLLLQESRDALGNRVTVGERLPDGSLDQNKPGHDYRTLEPWRVMDANRNRGQVAFDVFGNVVATAVLGKPEENLGDSLDNVDPDPDESFILDHILHPLTKPEDLLGLATTRMVYDVFAFSRSKNLPNPEPSVIFTLARETHCSDLARSDSTEIHLGFSYLDGFGREIQKKAQVEAGPTPSRDSEGKLLLDSNNLPIPTSADTDPRWAASGWIIFNNKGSPVRQYQPFFSDTHLFEFDVCVGVSPVLFYDPQERLIATLNPNHTYKKVVFDAWQQATYDENDTCALRGLQTGDPRTDPDIAGYVAAYFKTQPSGWKTWYAGRQGGGLGTVEQTAAVQASAHADTPITAYFDSLGRTFLTISENRVICSGHDLDGTEDQFAARVEMDIEGNQRVVRDAIEQVGDAQGRIAMRYEYDMLSNRIHQASMEAGERWLLNDATGKPLYAWDNLSHIFHTVYDSLRRPLKTLVTGADPAHPDQEILTERLVYGEQHPEAELCNLRGKPYLHFDQAGSTSDDRHDFKGNPIQGSRRLAKNYNQVTDWSGLEPSLPANPTDPLNLTALGTALVAYLEPDVYTSQTTYNALNHPLLLTTPDQSTIRLTINKGNLLEQVHVNLKGTTSAGQPVWTPFITNIDYGADRQRLLIEQGNTTSTKYAYDPLTLRMVSVLTSRDASTYPADCPSTPATGWPGCQVQNLTYTFDPVGNITNVRDDAQQTIFFRNKRVEPSAAYVYDAVYRLIQASGREQLGQVGGQPIPHSYRDSFRIDIPHPADGQAMGTYLERYVYDAVGNFQKMQHVGSDPAAPGWTRSYSYNETSQIENGLGGNLLKTNNRLSQTQIGSGPNAILEVYSYDAHGNVNNLPELQLLQWDFQEQLERTSRQAVSSEDADGSAHQGEQTWYTYDASGQRVRKVTEGRDGLVKEQRIYVGGCEVYHLYRGNNAGLVRESLHVMDDLQRVALVETRNEIDDGSPQQLTRYQYNNHLGSTGLELDDHAQVISYEEYTPFGSTSFQSVRNDIEVPLKRYRYTGKERDEETGLYYHGARYYAPWLGRWISPDPKGLIDGPCVYCYCSNDPIALHDPSGTAGKLVFGMFDEKVGKIWEDAAVKALGPRFKATTYGEVVKAFQAEVAKKIAEKGGALGSNSAKGTAINYARKTYSKVRSEFGKMAVKEGYSLKGIQVHHGLDELGELAKAPAEAITTSNLRATTGNAATAGSGHNFAHQVSDAHAAGVKNPGQKVAADLNAKGIKPDVPELAHPHNPATSGAKTELSTGLKTEAKALVKTEIKEGLEVGGKEALKTVEKTGLKEGAKIVGTKAAKFIPFVGIGVGVGLVAYDLKNKDYASAAWDTAEAIPVVGDVVGAGHLGIAAGTAANEGLGIDKVAAEHGMAVENKLASWGVSRDTGRIFGATTAALSAITVAPNIAIQRKIASLFQ
jgi:RHS repeat-associated protein